MPQIIQISEGTFRIEDEGVRFFLLEGGESALLIDSGMRTPNAREIAESLTKLPLRLLNTHADRDHISGNPCFDETYMSPAEAGNYESAQMRIAAEAGLQSAGAYAKTVPVREGDIIDLGGRPLEIIDNPGHTPGSIAILDVNNRFLIGGDAIQDDKIFMFGPFRNIARYVESLEHILEYKDRFDVIYPSHGTFPVEPGIIEKLICGAREIMDGTSKGVKMEIFGNEVILHQFPYAGFLCDM